MRFIQVVYSMQKRSVRRYKVVPASYNLHSESEAYREAKGTGLKADGVIILFTFCLILPLHCAINTMIRYTLIR